MKRKIVQTFSVQTKVSTKLFFTPDGRRDRISGDTGDELVMLDTATRQQITK